MSSIGKNMQTAIGRWSGLGPYYAMFPIDFTFQVIEQFSHPGQSVLDPFAGRGSSIYAASALERTGLGIEINPVGWLYGSVKLQPATKRNVLSRITEVERIAQTIGKQYLKKLPEFFHLCYSDQVLRFLVAARETLRWKISKVDATLLAIILVYLHGKREQSLSNQMRQGKSMSPDYSVAWWKKHGLTPPEIDPVDFLVQRVEWRYGKGSPKFTQARVLLGDSTKLVKRIEPKGITYNLLFTSPPYYSITNYHADQWLRLWMLGGPERPTYFRGKWEKRFESKAQYQHLLYSVFSSCAKVMSPNATVYVRTDAREYTYLTTLEILRNCFPQKTVEIIEQPFKSQTQTALFGDKSNKPGEIDIIMRP